MMKGLCLIISLCVVQSLGDTSGWDRLTVKYGIDGSSKNVNSMFHAPSFIGEEVDSGSWVSTTIDNFYNLQTLSYKVDNDYGFNPMYDQNGFLAGVHACQPMNTIQRSSPSTYNPVLLGTIEVKSLGGIDHYCSSLLLVSPDTLNAGGKTAAGSSIGEGLWLRDTTNTETGYKKIPDNLSDVLSSTDFTWQNCFPRMGTHYFFNSTETFVCEQFYNWFLLGDKTTNTVHGVGFVLIGSSTVYNTDYYDPVTRAFIETIVPITNECIYEWVDLYNLASMHIYFKSNPEDIACATGDGVSA